MCRQCLIGIDAGMATHYVGRELIALGHDVSRCHRFMPNRSVKVTKNDFREAHAIAEAVQRPTTRCVPVKTVINWICKPFTRIDVLSPRMSRILEDLSGDWRQLDERIEQLTQEIELLARGTERCRQLMTIPGIGPTADQARSHATSPRGSGLVPKQMSTGDRTILGRISKRGNRYLRTMFMQGAQLRIVARGRAKRLHHNVLATALANKLARIAWTVLTISRQLRSARHGGGGVR